MHSCAKQNRTEQNFCPALSLAEEAGILTHCSGPGVMLLPDGSMYAGAFASDRFDGRGTYEYSGGRGCHMGEWHMGRKHGKARQRPRTPHTPTLNPAVHAQMECLGWSARTEPQWRDWPRMSTCHPHGYIDDSFLAEGAS